MKLQDLSYVDTQYTLTLKQQVCYHLHLTTAAAATVSCRADIPRTVQSSEAVSGSVQFGIQEKKKITDYTMFFCKGQII